MAYYKDDVIRIRKGLKLSQDAFGKLLGVSRETVNRMENSDDPVSRGMENTIKQVVKIREEISQEESEKKGKEVIALGKKIPMRLKENEFADAFPDWKGIPVFNLPISASFVQHYQDENTYEPMYHLRDPRFKDCNFAAIITGDSMHSEIRHGDYVVCQEITDMSFILYGDIYYVSSKNGIETCKYVNADPNDKDSIMLVPKNEKISPTSMKRKMINKLYKVKGIIRGY